MSPLDKHISKENIQQAAIYFLSQILKGKISADNLSILLEKEIPGRDQKRKKIKAALEQTRKEWKKKT